MRFFVRDMVFKNQTKGASDQYSMKIKKLIGTFSCWGISEMGLDEFLKVTVSRDF